MLRLLWRKVILTVHAVAVQRATEIIYRVANGLQLRYLAKHLLYLTLRGIRQAAFAHLVQIGSNLHLHRVGDILILPNA